MKQPHLAFEIRSRNGANAYARYIRIECTMILI